MNRHLAKTFLFTTTVFTLLVGLTSCATLDKSECQTANWEIVGLEDGSDGRNSSYVGKHRKACSTYGITPDLNAYLRGHKAGLKQFCTEQNGYDQALRGQRNGNVCPAGLATAFNRGYKTGYRFYFQRAEINKLKSKIASHERRLRDIEEVKAAKNEEIIDHATKEYRRRELLDEMSLMG